MTTYRVLRYSACRDFLRVEGDKYYSVSGDIISAFSDAVKLVSSYWHRDEFFSVNFEPDAGFANGSLQEELGFVVLFENNPWFNEANVEGAHSKSGHASIEVATLPEWFYECASANMVYAERRKRKENNE